MATELFLNELSVPHGPMQLADATDSFKVFVQTVRTLARLGRVIFNSDVSINNLMLGENLSVALLRNQNQCAEESLFLKTLQNRSPFTAIVDQFGEPLSGEYEYRLTNESPWPNRTVSGLGLAHLYDGIAVSFASEDFWQTTFVPLVQTVLKDDAGLIEQNVLGRNCSHPDLAPQHQALFQTQMPDNGADAWDQRETLFPNLQFIPRVEGQMKGLLRGERSTGSALSKLRELSVAVGTWGATAAAHPSWPFNVRPESQGRIEQGLVNFHTAEGTIVTFSDHLDYGPIEGRIHFRLETHPARHALVGHVGRKIGIG